MCVCMWCVCGVCVVCVCGVCVCGACVWVCDVCVCGVCVHVSVCVHVWCVCGVCVVCAWCMCVPMCMCVCLCVRVCVSVCVCLCASVSVCVCIIRNLTIPVMVAIIELRIVNNFYISKLPQLFNLHIRHSVQNAVIKSYLVHDSLINSSISGNAFPCRIYNTFNCRGSFGNLLKDKITRNNVML